MAISIATNYSGRSASVSTPASTETINRNSSNREAESSLQKQLSLLVLIRCLRTAQLAPPPIVVPFYQNSCHLEPSAILWLGSWYSALVAACEFPSGVLSDVLGRKTTLQLAFIGLGLCWIVTYGSSLSSSSSSMIVVWLGLAQIFRAVGSSLYSGTDMALLYELLKKTQNTKSKPERKSSHKEGGQWRRFGLEIRITTGCFKYDNGSRGCSVGRTLVSILRRCHGHSDECSATNNGSNDLLWIGGNRNVNGWNNPEERNQWFVESGWR